jgi:hypothetical protein
VFLFMTVANYVFLYTRSPSHGRGRLHRAVKVVALTLPGALAHRHVLSFTDMFAATRRSIVELLPLPGERAGMANSIDLVHCTIPSR